MLSKESKTFLRWLRKQPEPISQDTMVKRSAPEYAPSRIESLREEGYITRSLTFENGELTGLYAISDKGRAVLQGDTVIFREKAAEWIRYTITTVIAVIALIRTFS